MLSEKSGMGRARGEKGYSQKKFVKLCSPLPKSLDVSGAHVIKFFNNWHKAVNGGGLSEDHRSKSCNDLIEWILAD